jgi:hypothetical protein
MLRYSVRGRSMRIDMMRDTAQVGTAVSQIYDLRRGTFTFLMAGTKTYMQLSPGTSAGPPPARPPDGDSTRFVPTGSGEEIAGIPCQVYVARTHGTVAAEACVANGMGSFVPFRMPASIGGMPAMPANVSELASRYAGDTAADLFPLKLVTHDNGVTLTIVATHVSRDLPDNSTFEIPPDYKRMAFPGLP